VSMEYVAIKNALDALLESKSASRYAVRTNKARQHDAESVLSIPQVTTYYKQGAFDKGDGSYQGPFGHAMTFSIDILVGATASMDLSAITDTSTAEEIAAVLSASIDAESAVDAKWDEIVGIIWSIIMDPVNDQLGLSYSPNRWVTQIQKNDSLKKGAIVLLSGSITMTAEAPEYPAGETGAEGTGVDNIIETTAGTSGENLDSAKQGVKVGN
jgi:hypothetical protein